MLVNAEVQISPLPNPLKNRMAEDNMATGRKLNPLSRKLFSSNASFSVGKAIQKDIGGLCAFDLPFLNQDEQFSFPQTPK